MYQLIHGDCLQQIRSFADCSVDLVCTDPPYIIGAQGCGLAADRQYLHDISTSALNNGRAAHPAVPAFDPSQ